MIKKVISILIIGIMVHSVYVCGRIASEEANYDEINETTQEESSESETIQDKEISEEKEEAPETDELQLTEDDESAEPIYIIEPRLVQDDTYEMQDWQAAYAEYIEGVEYAPYNKYALIYVDEDDIPELVIYTGTVATACIVLTFHDGEVDTLQTWSLQCNYIEKKNLYWDAGGQMGEYFDRIYTIENGKWVHVEGGGYIAKLDEDGLITEEYDYAWEGKSVSGDEYYENLREVYDIEENQNVGSEQYEKLDEMLFCLQTGTALSQTHRYELYVEDITWDEAKRRCEEKGGYLATITTLEEYEFIKKGIEDSGQTQIAYWLGASDRPSSAYGYRWHEPNWSSLSYTNYSIMEKYWADGEPGYSRQASDELIDRLCIYLLYDDAKRNCYLYNAPKDMIMRNPEYTGKIGYICEYGVTVKAKETYYHADGSVDYWTEYGFDDAGNQTKKIEYDADGSVDHWSEYGYDSAGNRTESISYNADGSFDGSYEYEYDDVGNPVKEIGRNSKGNIYCWYEYEYDSVGNRIKNTSHYADGRIAAWSEYEYDSAGNETKYIVHSADGGIFYRYEYEYDSLGNEIKNINYKEDGSIDVWSENEYNSEGNKTKHFIYHADGNAYLMFEFEYDSAGNPSQEIEYDCADGSIIYRKENVYDSVGNKTQEIYYNADGSVDRWYKYERDNKGNITKTYYQEDGSTREHEYEREYDYMGNETKYIEYRQGEIYERYQCEYMTIYPHYEVTASN